MKKYLIAAIAALAVFAGAAFAASLTVNAGTLQAGTDPIDTCVATNVTVSYDEPAFENGVYLLEGLTLTPAPGDDCNGLTFTVVVTGDNSLQTTAKSGVFSAGSGSVTYTGTERFNADDATDVHVAIRNTAS